MKDYRIEGQLRTDLSSATLKTLRANGGVPCNLYQDSGNVTFSVTSKDLKGITDTPDFFRVIVCVDGKEYPSILKDYQVHPVTDNIMSVDFLPLIEGRKIITTVPIKTLGVAAGVKTGGKLVMKLRSIKYKALPKNMVDKIEVDVTTLELGRSVKVGDIKAIEGVEILNTVDVPIASIEIPRALKSAQAAGEEVAEA